MPPRLLAALARRGCFVEPLIDLRAAPLALATVLSCFASAIRDAGASFFRFLLAPCDRPVLAARLAAPHHGSSPCDNRHFWMDGASGSAMDTCRRNAEPDWCGWQDASVASSGFLSWRPCPMSESTARTAVLSAHSTCRRVPQCGRCDGSWFRSVTATADTE